MLAGNYLDFLTRFGGNHFTRPQMLTMLNEAQNHILGENIKYMVRVVPLATTSGTLTYSIESSPTSPRARQVREVFAFSPTFLTTNVPQSVSESGEQVFRVVDLASTLGSPDLGGCSITFSQDPGNTTDTYFVTFYEWPEQILVEETQITIPDQYLDVLRYRILMLIEEIEYGISEAHERNYRSARQHWLYFANRDSHTSMLGSWGPSVGVKHGLYS